MDCSHTGRRCSLEIMEASSGPVIFSHSNPLALVEHGRNVTDEQIRKCAATGGVTCVSGVSMFVGTRAPGVDDVARHAAYVAELVGAEHAGIGLDISFHQPGVDETPPGDFDATYWWPKAAGYDRALQRSTYPSIESWNASTMRSSAPGCRQGRRPPSWAATCCASRGRSGRAARRRAGETPRRFDGAPHRPARGRYTRTRSESTVLANPPFPTEGTDDEALAPCRRAPVAARNSPRQRVRRRPGDAHPRRRRRARGNAQGHAGRRVGDRRHHHDGPGRVLRDLRRRDHGQCL